jgi:hypothetical protein
MTVRANFPMPLQFKLLGAILEFMGKSGVSDADIRSSFELGMTGLRTRKLGGKLRRDGKYVGNGNVSAELIRLWHRDGRYIDKDARPRPLSLTRGRSSLKSLVARLDPTANASEILQSMRVVGLIRRTSKGKYVPTAESVTIGQLHPLAVEHVAKSVIRLVSTVCRNTDPRGRSFPLIERYAYVPDLNPSDMAEFGDFTRTQGMAYLETVDDWLEQRRVGRTRATTKKGRVGVTAGVHLVAYLGDAQEGGSEPTVIEGRSINRSSRSYKRLTTARAALA